MKRALKTAPHLHASYLNDHDLQQFFDFFMREKNIEITVTDAVAITSLMIYQKLFGFGPVDTLIYDNSIDELWFGTCGAEFGSARHVVSPLNSVMVSISNNLIRLQFLHFQTQSALENCVVALSSNGEGTFTSDDGYKFTTLRDLRRVTSRRPPLSDRYAVNVRKLDYQVWTNRGLLERNPIEIHGTEFAQHTLQLFMWSMMNVGFIGDQGAGKTSHINASVDLLEPDVAIRAFGNIDESQFGNRYPERDIQHFFQTPRQGLHEVAGVGRRTRGMYIILMEVIDGESGQEAINNLKSGYIGGMLSGHGGNAHQMVEFMAQLLAMGQSTSSIETTKIVASVLNSCIKVMKYGNIFCYENITEIIPRDWSIDWVDVHPDNTSYISAHGESIRDSIDFIRAENDKLYYKNALDPALFYTQDIVYFNKETMTYEPKNRPTLGMCAKIFFRLAKERRKFFFNYMQNYFNVNILQELVDSRILILSETQSISDWM
jgi:type IV secretory pathway ATPase VirB11/archaellum biosynthesis ATPase